MAARTAALLIDDDARLGALMITLPASDHA
jgi:hypothetical protein